MRTRSGWLWWECPWPDEPTYRFRQFGYDSKTWCCFYWFLGWDNISLGLHIYPPGPHIEIHVPFGYFRIGRRKVLS